MKNIIVAMIATVRLYDSGQRLQPKTAGVLMVVQSNNVNTCDERPIEYMLWAQGVPCYRVEWGEDTIARTSLGSRKELLFHPKASDADDKVEIGLVYYRAGYDLEEYDSFGREARCRLESSKAIKCPSILGHLATMKIVQQKLAMPEHLERFLIPKEAREVETLCVPMYPLDDSQMGKIGQKLALNEEAAACHVLKPSLEGGGHNVFATDIPAFLRSIPKSSWKEYILMELIRPPPVQNVLLSPRGPYSGPVVCELGVWSSCFWRSDRDKAEVFDNRQLGFSMRTKRRDVDEMSVVKGYGCFDSPLLL